MLSKNFVRASLGVAALLFLAVPGLQAQEGAGGPVKIAVVDLDRIVAQSKAGQDLQARLQQFEQDVKGELQRQEVQANDIRDRLATGGNSLSEDKLNELRKEFEDAAIASKRYRDDKQREGQKLQQEGLRVIEQSLEPVFEKIRDDMGLDLILNYVPGVVVMASEKVDITDQVIEAYNASAGGGGQ